MCGNNVHTIRQHSGRVVCVYAHIGLCLRPHTCVDTSLLAGGKPIDEDEWEVMKERNLFTDEEVDKLKKYAFLYTCRYACLYTCLCTCLNTCLRDIYLAWPTATVMCMSCPCVSLHNYSSLSRDHDQINHNGSAGPMCRRDLDTFHIRYKGFKTWLPLLWALKVQPCTCVCACVRACVRACKHAHKRACLNTLYKWSFVRIRICVPAAFLGLDD